MKTMKMFMMAMMMTIVTSASASTTTHPRNDRNRQNPAMCMIDHKSPKYKDANYCPLCGTELHQPAPAAKPSQKTTVRKQKKNEPARVSFGNQRRSSFGSHR